MHAEAFGFVARVLRPYGPRKSVVEIGSKIINGTIRTLFYGKVDRYIGIDVVPGNGVDVVASGHEYQPDAPVDTVICMEVLEHTPLGREICENAHRMLAPGGIFIVTAAAEPREPHRADDNLPPKHIAEMLKGAWTIEMLDRAVEEMRDRPFDEYYQNVSPEMLAEWLKPFAEVTIEHNTSHGDVYAIAEKAR